MAAALKYSREFPALVWMTSYSIWRKVTGEYFFATHPYMGQPYKARHDEMVFLMHQERIIYREEADEVRAANAALTSLYEAAGEAS